MATLEGDVIFCVQIEENSFWPQASSSAMVQKILYIHDESRLQENGLMIVSS